MVDADKFRNILLIILKIPQKYMQDCGQWGGLENFHSQSFQIYSAWQYYEYVEPCCNFAKHRPINVRVCLRGTG